MIYFLPFPQSVWGSYFWKIRCSASKEKSFSNNNFFCVRGEVMLKVILFLNIYCIHPYCKISFGGSKIKHTDWLSIIFKIPPLFINIFFDKVSTYWHLVKPSAIINSSALCRLNFHAEIHIATSAGGGGAKKFLVIFKYFIYPFYSFHPCPDSLSHIGRYLEENFHFIKGL